MDQSECRGRCCQRGGDGPSRGCLRRRHRRLSDPESDTQDHLHGRADHGRRARRRAGLLRALHDRLQQQVPRGAPVGAGPHPLVLLDGLRRPPAVFGGHRRPTPSTSSWPGTGRTGRSCSSTTRASPRTPPTSACSTRPTTCRSGIGDVSASPNPERRDHAVLECRCAAIRPAVSSAVGVSARRRTR